MSTRTLPSDAHTYLLTATWNPTAGSTLLAGGGNNGVIYIWDASKDLLPVDQKDPPASIKSPVKALAWSVDGQWLAAAYNDTNASIVVWKM
jgi:WD40 repeat protein